MEIHTIGIDLGKTGFPWNYLQPLGRTFRYRDDGRPGGRSHVPAEAQEAAVTAGCSDSRVKQ